MRRPAKSNQATTELKDRCAAGTAILLPPPRDTVAFVALILVAPAALFLSARLAWQPSAWRAAAPAWLVLAPFAAATAHQFTRRLRARAQP